MMARTNQPAGWKRFRAGRPSVRFRWRASTSASMFAPRPKPETSWSKPTAPRESKSRSPKAPPEVIDDPNFPAPWAEARSTAMPPIMVTPPPPSPARDAQAVADRAAKAIATFSQWFGPYPYGSLALTQMPGDLKPGMAWPRISFELRLSQPAGAERSASRSGDARARQPGAGPRNGASMVGRSGALEELSRSVDRRRPGKLLPRY